MTNSYLKWDEYFIGIAALSALRSKDPSSKVGACIVNQDKHIIGVGYNGFPTGCSDEEFSWEKEAKLQYVVHAEANAILNATTSLKGATLYVTRFPCNECAKLIIQAGIKEVVWCGKINPTKWNSEAVFAMFKAAGVTWRYTPAAKLDVNFVDEYSK